MGVEIERKWLVKELPQDISRYPNKKYIQAYLCTSPVVRVRKEGNRYEGKRDRRTIRRPNIGD